MNEKGIALIIFVVGLLFSMLLFWETYIDG
jgi:hypothetical protein